MKYVFFLSGLIISRFIHVVACYLVFMFIAKEFPHCMDLPRFICASVDGYWIISSFGLTDKASTSIRVYLDIRLFFSWVKHGKERWNHMGVTLFKDTVFRRGGPTLQPGSGFSPSGPALGVARGCG